MATTHFSGPVYAGPQKDETGDSTDPKNIGPVMLSQSKTITQNGADVAVDATFYIPPGAIIIDIIFDILTQFDSGTSATGTVGTTSGGTQFAGGVNAKTGIRVRPTFTAAQLAAMNGVSVLGVAAPIAGTVVATITTSGATTAGFVVVTIEYVQLPTDED